MASALTSYVVVGIQLLGIITIYADTDPCNSYLELSDNILQANVRTLGWYRFMSTDSGLLATSCPDDDVCSSPDGVIWMNDMLQTNTTGNVTVCLKTQTECCSQRSTVQMRNCAAGYVVYRLTPGPLQTAYCFNNTESISLATSEANSEQSDVRIFGRANHITTSPIGVDTSRGPIKTPVLSDEASDWSDSTPSTNETTTVPGEEPEEDDDKAWIKITIVVAVIVVIVLIGVARIIRWKVVQNRKKVAGLIKPKPVVDISRKTSTV